MMSKHEQEQATHSSTNVSKRREPGWKKWIGRGILAVIVFVSLSLAWPMLKGMYYGVAPAANIPADQLPDWRNRYEAALAEAERSGKPVLIDFTAEWCPPCRVMKREVWPDKQVRQTIDERVIPLKVDIDKRSSASVTRQYSIRTIPTIILVSADGKTLNRGSFMDVGDMLEFIRSVTDTSTTATVRRDHNRKSADAS
jgi:protein disulfide-isomerase